MLTFGEDASEQRLAAYWAEYVDAGRRGPRHALTHMGESWQAWKSIRRLPVLEASPSDSPGGRAVRDVLETRASYGVPGRLLGTAVLEVPPAPDDYLLGRRAQTLRRKIRSAQRRGLAVRRVADPAERRALLGVANNAEQKHADPAYRVSTPNNHDLLQHDVWLVVESPEGTPLLLSVTPHDGRFAILRYFRTLGSGQAHTDARYLASSAVVAELAERGVRYLMDTATPPEQTNGLRHFQRMVGFRYARVRLR
jgi:hypothetical protein